MKVTPGNIGGLNFEFNKRPKAAPGDKAAGKHNRASFDKILIGSHAKAEETSGGAFANKLRAQLAAEAKSGAGEKKIADLKREIALGNYDINPADTARKILGE